MVILLLKQQPWVEKLPIFRWCQDHEIVDHFIFKEQEKFYEVLDEATQEYYIRDYAEDELGGEIPILDFDVFDVQTLWHTPTIELWDHIKKILFHKFLDDGFFEYTEAGEITAESQEQYEMMIECDYDLHMEFVESMESIWRHLFYSFRAGPYFYNSPVRTVW